MALSGVKGLDEKGVKGYFMPKVLVKERVITHPIIKNAKNETYLDQIMKAKALIPSPSQFNLDKQLFKKMANPITSKSPRKTPIDEVQNFQKKHKFPGVGQYQVKPVLKRIQLGLSDKTDRVGYLEEAILKAASSPGFIDPKYKGVDPK
mmetsp:Transcript_9268/g.15595  ORF Transcript_9268/g.15595 Transcript_9268/m.15595 type:complete len:149 (+) Transcript_9268:426-872(+)